MGSWKEEIKRRNSGYVKVDSWAQKELAVDLRNWKNFQTREMGWGFENHGKKYGGGVTGHRSAGV